MNGPIVVRACPVCWRNVCQSTSTKAVARHEDKLGSACPMSGRRAPLPRLAVAS